MVILRFALPIRLKKRASQENKLALMMFGKKIVKEGGTGVTDMRNAGRTGGKTNSNHMA